jgi:hypothetical protein
MIESAKKIYEENKPKESEDEKGIFKVFRP